MTPKILPGSSYSWKTPSVIWLDKRLAQKISVVFLYANDKGAEKEIRPTTNLIVATDNIKCRGVTLTKQLRELYDKNFNFLNKEIGEDMRR